MVENWKLGPVSQAAAKSSDLHLVSLSSDLHMCRKPKKIFYRKNPNPEDITIALICWMNKTLEDPPTHETHRWLSKKPHTGKAHLQEMSENQKPPEQNQTRGAREVEDCLQWYTKQKQNCGKIKLAYTTVVTQIACI